MINIVPISARAGGYGAPSFPPGTPWIKKITNGTRGGGRVQTKTNNEKQY
jgi:hypothetical protein